MKMRVQKTMAEVVAKASYKMAEKNANSTCIFLHGQPQIPECVKRMNKNSK